ncbi:MAG: hypothetical protein ACREQZ_15455, partial [Woeseiaceae bacterium]
MAMLFECAAEISAPAMGSSHPVKLQVSLNAAYNKLIDIALLDESNPANNSTTSFKLTAPAPFTAAAFTYDSLDETVTLEIDLNNDPIAATRFRDSGAAGISFKTDAILDVVRIVLRPRPEGGDWSSQAPCFAVVVCWTVTAAAAKEVHTTDPGTVIAADAEATVEVCAGFSAIFPNMGDFGLPAFQVRLDLPTFGLTSNWVPLAWFEVGDLSPFRFNGLVKWFGDLAGFNWSGFPSFPLPTWNVDLPFQVDLPLGIGARKTALHLSRLSSGGLVISALAEDFYLAWKDAELDLGGRVELAYVEGPPARYTFEATLFELQYPNAGETDLYSFSLPFDIVALKAECWYLRMGLFASGVSTPVKACFEFLLEIGGFTVSSSLMGGDSGARSYRSDVRLLMRDFKILTNAMQGVPGAPAFLARAKSTPSDPFEKYQQTPIEIPTLSFARDLLAQKPPASSPANDYGMEFLDGDFRAGERVFILWRQNGLRFIRALAHDLLGRRPAGAVGADETATLFGLEITQFVDAATQLRLDWRPIGASPASATPGSEAPAPITTGDKCFKIDTTKPLAINLPLASHGVFLDVPPADAILLNLPAIAIEVARPKDQSIIIRREPDGRKSVSHLLLFEGQSAAGAAPVAPLARARIGFSLKDNEDSAEHREVVETDQDNCFLTVAVGYAGSGAKALRTLGWTTDQSPRFLQTLRAEAEPVRPLLPPTVPAITTGDPGCPGVPSVPPLPVPFDFDAFETPDFSDSAWRLSLKIAAATSLFKAFKSPDPNQQIKFSIEEICQSEDNAHAALIQTDLSFRLGTGADAFEAAGKVTFRFDIRDLALSVEDGAALAFKLPPFQPPAEIPGWAREAPLPRKASDYWYSQDTRLFSFEMTALAVKQAENEPAPEQIDVLVLSIKDGRFMLALPEGRHVVLRYDKLGRDSLNFWVTRFVLGPGGLDLEADLLSTGLRVKGLSRPFLLEKAGLRIRSSKLDYLSVEGSGRLPELLNEAPVRIVIAFEQRNADEPIELAEMHCELGDKDKPIFSRGARFKFEIEKLGIQFTGDRHFFFEVTGSAQFTPDGGEFDGGLLEDLKSARIEFVRAPLSDEFHKSLKLVVE